MAIKRSVVITCDGPCGTVVNSDVVPRGWQYMKFHEVHVPPGIKPHYHVAALCEKCTKTARMLLGTNGFAFSEVNAPQEEAVQAK
jgi:hypothetical protein